MSPLIEITPGTVALFLHGNVKGLALKLYRPGDEHRINARTDFAADFAAAGKILPDGPKWTLSDGAVVLGVGGVEPLGQGCWAAWAYLAEMTARQWGFGVMMARAVLAFVRQSFWVTEIHAEAALAEGADKVLEKIGFIACAQPRLYLMTGES